MRLTILLFLCVIALPASAQNVLRNGGFEGGDGNLVSGWQAVGTGFDADRQTFRNGAQSIRCDSANTNADFGAQTTIALPQPAAAPLVITGWSRADSVRGASAGDYALAVTLVYADGERTERYAPFSDGSHDWQRRQLTVIPDRPIQSLIVQARFNRHSGTAWFDDFYARTVTGDSVFDGQVLTMPPRTAKAKPPLLHSAGHDGIGLTWDAGGSIVGVTSGGAAIESQAAGGFFARDVAGDGAIVPLRGTAQVRKAGGITVGCASGDLRLVFNANIIAQNDGLLVDGELTDTTNTDRAVTVYFALPVAAIGWHWGQDIGRSEPIAAGREYANLTNVNVGATGTLSRYPFCCVSKGTQGIGIASQMDWASVYRMFYNAATRQLVVAWDFALSGKTATWQSHNARFRCTLFRLPPASAKWGFRAAASRFYALNAPNFARTNSAALTPDDLTHYRRAVPSTLNLPLPPAAPPIYESAVAALDAALAETKTQEPHRIALAIQNSGVRDTNGRYQVVFDSSGGANTAQFIVNPNPELPAAPEKPTAASLLYGFADAQAFFGAASKSGLAGVFLDGLEAQSDTLDYRPLDLQTSPYPIPFDSDSRRPVFPQWYAAHAFTRFVANDLHAREKRLLADVSPGRFSVFASLLDGRVETTDGTEGDDIFALRRALCGKSPCLLLLKNSGLSEEKRAAFLSRCLFYGFATDAEPKNAALINMLTAAGWEPLTSAQTDKAGVTVERFGTHTFTVRNGNAAPVTANWTVEASALGIAPAAHCLNLVTGAEISATRSGSTLTVPLTLHGKEVAVLAWK